MVNHLLFMDDLKLYSRGEVQIHSLVKTINNSLVQISECNFGIKKCGVLTLKRGKVAEYEGIVSLNGETMRIIEDVGYKYLGI